VKGRPLVPLNATEIVLSVSAEYLSPEDRIALVGENSNPFLHWGNIPLLVFRVSIAGVTRDIKIFYDAFEIRYADGARSPIPKFYITQYWDNKLGRYSANKSIRDWTSNRKRYSRWTSGKVAYNVRMYTVPEKKKIERGEGYEGLVLFEGPPPKRRSLILSVPLYAETGKELSRLDFEYTPSP